MIDKLKSMAMFRWMRDRGIQVQSSVVPNGWEPVDHEVNEMVAYEHAWQ